ncbi:hypothetical protein N7509_008133 [Penicillium cosmopolitanum]|uniref:FAD-binding PCMH-type domain-containing protein n=1 Tax=Penicillium cosmopolitanum TaxID=1131564 RepID=A0A9W9W070_9EURO|nr:uncharacterized protein N7509_008133 [Penicillium cosmopolitanum]KAJ5392643.1 hypothetical protein N7509_008133 [Penicillium cosmopolitanum]
MNRLIQFLSVNPHIRHGTPESPGFAELREQFVIQETRTPGIIVRPRTIEDIASLVKILTTSNLPFSVRGGGHDMFGRTVVQDGVSIDMREVSHIYVDKASHTAQVGGGVINLDLHRELDKHKMTTAHAVTPSVGYTGWAIHGGYGLLSNNYGLGSDQIVGARVVDGHGNIVDADETLLTAIRGGGGSVAVIYELLIKVYPSEKILGGFFGYQSADLVATIRQYNENYRKLKEEGIPPAMSLYQAVMDGPEGRAFTVFVIWSSSNLEEGQKWVDRVAGLAPIAVKNVTTTTILEFSEVAATITEKTSYATIFCPGFYDLTPEVVDIIGTYAKSRPKYSGPALGIHELRAEAPREFANSVFNARDPHFLVEILPLSSSLEVFEELREWGQRFYDALMKTDPANIYPISYIPLSPDERLDLKVIYGNRYETLKKAKQQYDPKNAFKHSVVRP